ncbi:TATA-binding protein-associated factor Mot1p [[Candida] jaroonii]|uniref:TATA-binding protein-associated factor Mot1p n=1 Tax=[Candida] jaroonii TaxID=467808 RepID=A0ACA9Y6F2_9ASCO|nr:TATA-binding protein-associated factor Mot1p [[Candida] jaroonii]
MSRLDRLVVLLETGSTPFIRNTAADQLSDLAKGHPEDTLNLLGRVYPFLKSPKWETRVAAARAFGNIVNHSPIWEPNGDNENDDTPIKDEDIPMKDENGEEIKVKTEDFDEFKLEQDKELAKINENLVNLVNFNNWDLIEILKSNKKLLASNINDINDSFINHDDSIDDEINPGGLSLLSKFKRHKTNNSIKSEVDEIKQEIKREAKSEIKEEVKVEEKPIKEVSAASNARLKAMQKRRAKANAKAGFKNKQPIDLSQSSISTKMMQDPNNLTEVKEEVSFDITSQQGGEKLVLETKVAELSPILNQHSKVAGLVWQFQGVFELLVDDLFDDKWEIRHGACLGIRELIKKHGKSAGKIKTNTKAENTKNNSAILEDLAVRLCTLFALDRFGDYVSDTVVAPVRESGAQALAALLIHLDEDVLLKTFRALNKLVLQEGYFPKCWEAKHGGMLGVRYFVSVRTEILTSKPELINDVVSMVLNGLEESDDDDVQSVSALTLTPLVNEFITYKRELIQVLLKTIWDCLVNLRDDLSASIGSVMDLLSKLSTHQEVIDIMEKQAVSDSNSSFENLVPRLYPFLRHSIANVRKSVLKTILEFLSINNPNTKTWINDKTLRLIFQNMLVEQNEEVLRLSSTVYSKIVEEINSNELLNIDEIFTPNFAPLLTLVMTPIGIARHNYRMKTNLIMRPSGKMVTNGYDSNGNSRRNSISDYEEEPVNGRKKRKNSTEKPEIPLLDLKVNIDTPIFNGDVLLVGYDVFIRTRTASAKAFGETLSIIGNHSLLTGFLTNIHNYFKSNHSAPRLYSAIIIQEYCHHVNTKKMEIPSMIKELYMNDVMKILTEPETLPHYRELVPTLKVLRSNCVQLFDVFINQAKVSPNKIPQLPIIVQGEAEAGPNAFGVENAEKLVNETYNKLLKNLSPTYKMTSIKALEDAKTNILSSIEDCKNTKNSRTFGILSTYASIVLEVDGIPKKLNPIIRSFMDSIKNEESRLLQLRSASSISQLVEKLYELQKNNVGDKIIKNLCGFLCVDTSEVPEFHHNVQFTTNVLSLRKEEAKTDPVDIATHEKAVHEAKIKRQGALLSFECLLKTYQENLFKDIPKLKELIFEPLKSLTKPVEELTNDESIGQSIVDALGILRALLPRMNESLYNEVTDNLSLLLPGFTSELSVFRYSTAKCFATIASICPIEGFTFLIKSILPMLSNAGDLKERQGAIETIYHLSSTMGSDILPYVVFLIVPVLGRMSDSDGDVRILATTTFASIIKLVPLEAGIPDPPNMPQELLEGRDRERDFIQQMMDPTKIQPFDLPVSIKATLRKYQQDGVNWLHFLNKYHLHGILCDDMGLGKTLQTICIVSSDHYLRDKKFTETQSVEFRKLPSLVVCPPSVTGHWEQEINQYSPFLKVLVYVGGPSIRSTLREQLDKVDIVVTSYDVCRNDVEILGNQNFNYCVLDEGHIIKNSNSKLTKSVKKIKAEHRLILSGTPIQNNVLELWSLFDFLMPGFLGTEKVFNDKFAKPIAASRNSKTSSREQELGALALESLHKQVLPFMLRRLKEDVLSDLPPKIIQDYYCDLSPLQKQLYKDFANKQKSTIEKGISEGISDESQENKTHVFQALQYMRKLCNHPSLVLTAKHPKYNEVVTDLKAKNSSITNIEHSPKLVSLKNLLLECGIGVNDSELATKKKKDQLITSEGVISEHRALIFCQLKDMLDIVENDLLKKYLPSVTYMRLDGSTDPRDRQKIVRKFNEDPSIDLLLLTTKVGGLGLNLTGADTVIFVEHDWNPMNDLQAMDRAHRLGQKKVVNVYRLITSNTLEEKIMGLQKFKMNIASTIVNQQNVGLTSMDTNQLLDLFDVDENSNKLVEEPEEDKKDDDVSKDVGLTGKAAEAVGELGDLWDENQYEEEFNLDNFIKTLK